MKHGRSPTHRTDGTVERPSGVGGKSDIRDGMIALAGLSPSSPSTSYLTMVEGYPGQSEPLRQVEDTAAASAAAAPSVRVTLLLPLLLLPPLKLIFDPPPHPTRPAPFRCWLFFSDTINASMLCLIIFALVRVLRAGASLRCSLVDLITIETTPTAIKPHMVSQ
jgi:hypothetical protein